jgi:DNA-directed RNA polymerase subunit RPC12/RpoP
MMTIDDLNYLNDPRNQGPAEDKPILYLEEDNDIKEVELPTHWEVCDVCRGEGKHVNPAIDCGGISEEMEDDPDFRENYMSGMYDVTCNHCGGKRVVKGVDWEAMSDEHQKLYERQLQQAHNDHLEHMAELRMGA